MSAVADKLREARALIERGWTQGAFARNGSGHAVTYESGDASCFCVAGALLRATNGFSEFERAVAALHAVTRKAIHKWNDAPRRTKAEVVAALDKAIQLADAEQ